MANRKSKPLSVTAGSSKIPLGDDQLRSILNVLTEKKSARAPPATGPMPAPSPVAMPATPR